MVGMGQFQCCGLILGEGAMGPAIVGAAAALCAVSVVFKVTTGLSCIEVKPGDA